MLWPCYCQVSEDWSYFQKEPKISVIVVIQAIEQCEQT
jgi:hypothetical protein